MKRTTDCTTCPLAVLVLCLWIRKTFANAEYSNTIYLHMTDQMRKMNVPFYPMARAPSMGLSMSQTLGPQPHLSDLRRITP